ncbi:SMP-30/gluconolactonase/LRE family protein [Rhizobacter sp. P5_C2]
MTPNPLLNTLLKSCVSMLALGAALGASAQGAAVVVRGLQFPEGTVFAGNTLYFVDYATSDVLRLGGTKAEVVWHRDGCGPNGLAATPAGLLVACYDSGSLVQISLEGKAAEVIRSDSQGHPLVAPNDLATDARGGIYFTASGDASTPGKVFYRNAERAVREVASGINYSNGLVVSPDGKRLYVAESRAARLLVYAIGGDGALSDRREFVKLVDLLESSPGTALTPDGVRVDRHGNLFVGLYRGGGFAVISPGAKLLRKVELPSAHHANLAISPDGKTVFVTSTDDAPGGGYRGELLQVANPIGD